MNYIMSSISGSSVCFLLRSHFNWLDDYLRHIPNKLCTRNVLPLLADLWSLLVLIVLGLFLVDKLLIESFYSGRSPQYQVFLGFRHMSHGSSDGFAYVSSWSGLLFMVF